MRGYIALLSLFVGLGICLSYAFLFRHANAEGAEEGERWDVQAFKDLPQWEGLLEKPYTSAATVKRAWAAKKKVLERLSTRYSESEYADDVALALACGIAACEKDLKTAEALLTRIIEHHQEAKSIMGHWGPDLAARGESAPQARARDLSADQGAKTQPYGAIRRV